MSAIRKILLIAGLALLCASAGAQSPLTLDKSRERRGGGSAKAKPGTEKMIFTKVEMDPNSVSYKDYKDETLDELDKTMQEREWGSEDTAWARAQKLDTRQAYEKFISMYPYGKYVAEANCKLIDARVNETLSNAHQSLPNIKHIETDEPTFESTVEVTNHTGLPLTVYYSGIDKKSVLIPPDGKSTVILENGDYKLAASVPPQSIRPFAGQTAFVGGRYEIGFWIVPSH